MALATSVAGAAVVAVGGSLIALADGDSPHFFLEFLLLALPFLLIFAFLVTAAAMPLLALPAMLALRALEAETLGAYAGAGAAGGALLAVPLGWGGASIPLGFLLLVCPAYGALAAAFFFLLCRRSRRAPATAW